MKILSVFSFFLLLSILSTAQSKPFPQNVKYSFGYQPTSISNATILSNYNKWKAKYLKECGTDKLRVEFDTPPGTTVSEGQGYAMVISAYMGDSATFDKLYAFEKSMHNKYGNMGWKVDCNGFIAADSGSTSATDGDMDITFSLCIAAVQWGKNYPQLAKDRINILKKENFTYNTSAKRWIQEWRDGTTENFGNTSYWCAGYYRVFKEFSGDAEWDQIATDTYKLLLTTRNETTGFDANEVYVNATAKSDFVDYNGCRSPWRYVMDYLWNGNTDARNLVDKMTDWANSKGITKVVDGYKIDGTPTGGWNQSPAWTGAWACGAMAKSQAIVNTFTVNFNSCTYDSYYPSTLRLMYQLVLTGNYWKPSLLQVSVNSLKENEFKIKVTPNPVGRNSIINIDFNEVITNPIVVKIFSIQGKEIFTQTTVPHNREFRIKLINSYNSGIYFLEISGLSKVFRKEIVLQ
jgi:endoglucanase